MNFRSWCGWSLGYTCTCREVTESIWRKWSPLGTWITKFYEENKYIIDNIFLWSLLADRCQWLANSCEFRSDSKQSWIINLVYQFRILAGVKRPFYWTKKDQDNSFLENIRLFTGLQDALMIWSDEFQIQIQENLFYLICDHWCYRY